MTPTKNAAAIRHLASDFYAFPHTALV